MYKMILLAPIVLLTATCGAPFIPTPTDSGITGQALVGPVCPVVIEGQDCSDQPYQATLTVNSLEGRKIVQFETDEQGKFTIPLAPGEYILHPETPQDMPLPFAEEQRFTVLPGQYTRLTVLYDSGIR
jgi:hypothetical protein